MADLTVDRAVRDEDTITVYGTGFTKTTTQVTCDSEIVSFNWLSDTEITIDEGGNDYGEVTVAKGTATFTVLIQSQPEPDEREEIEEPETEEPGEPEPGSEFNMPSEDATNSTDDYHPRTEEEKAELLQVELVEPVAGEPNEPYPESGGEANPEDGFFAAHGYRRK